MDALAQYGQDLGDSLGNSRLTSGHVACVVAGARVATDQGLIAVEALQVGDLVLTLDHGMQTLRWCGWRRVASQGAFAAVSIPAGTFGNHGALRVPPQQRLLVSGGFVEVEADVALVRAVDLVQAGLLRQDHSGCPVTYHHLLFDRHAVINAEGLWGDSAPPGPRTLRQTDERRDDLVARFQEHRASTRPWLSRAATR